MILLHNLSTNSSPRNDVAGIIVLGRNVIFICKAILRLSWIFLGTSVLFSFFFIIYHNLLSLIILYDTLGLDLLMSDLGSCCSLMITLG